MSLDSALSKVQTSVPQCVAVGVVDLTTGMLLGVKTVDSHPAEVLDLVAAATGDLFQGDNVSAIEQTFRRVRGQRDDGAHYFREIVIFSENLLHIFQRCARNENIILTCVCRKNANLGMALVKARGELENVERSI
jgi:hypothetical protein